MRHTIVLIAAIGVLAIAATEFTDALSAPGQTTRTGAQKTMITIPQSLQTEHTAIHDALAEATQVPGPVGAAARELAAVLGPHFTRENEIALPPLGLLAALAAGEKPAGMEEALVMSDALRKDCRACSRNTQRFVPRPRSSASWLKRRRPPHMSSSPMSWRCTRGRRRKCYPLRPFSWVTSSERD